MYIVNNFQNDVLEYLIFDIDKFKLVTAIKEKLNIANGSVEEYNAFIAQRASNMSSYTAKRLEQSQYDALVKICSCSLDPAVLEDQFKLLQAELQCNISLSYDGQVFTFRAIGCTGESLCTVLSTNLVDGLALLCHKLEVQ